MVSLLVLAAAFAAGPGDAASPAPSALHEIGTTRATLGVCGNLALHANGAIASTLRNDATLERAIHLLRGVDLENNPMSRHSGLTDAAHIAGDLRDEAQRADDELKRLRDLAANRPGDESHAADVQSFADALGSAAAQQRKAGTDLATFLSYLDMQSMRELPQNDRGDQMAHSLSPVDNAPGTKGGLVTTIAPVSTPTSLFEHGSANQTAAATAADFESRLAHIHADELKAAEHSEAAVGGC